MGLSIITGAIPEDDFRNVERGSRAVNLPPEPIFYQAGQIARVVEVTMGEQHKINGWHIYREMIPVQQAQLFQTLKKPAIHQEFFPGRFYEVFLQS